MFKEEKICRSCDRQFIIVYADENDNVAYCPFCSYPIDHESDGLQLSSDDQLDSEEDQSE